ncbi:transcription factor Spi-C-like [Stegostoma tigrinum]|uniref:transcription factor Spi-C-like n=1 Tax=Stegostoma tigrinum TaxID=3053191 RepID=UPI00202B5629|nr:transcription factor Spi-C-like [Stegostoma tigrinum]
MGCCMQDNYAPLFNDAFEVIHHQQHLQPSTQFRQDPGLQYLPSPSLSMYSFQHYTETGPSPYCALNGQSQHLQDAVDLNLDSNKLAHENGSQFPGYFPDNHFQDLFIPRQGKGRRRLRLYEFLGESLHDSEMSDCIQWVDRKSGVFQFISKNKEKVAEMWGRRKGNRKTMTYQKMARALRNYSRTGEIVKVRRKLTYQFDAQVLQRLGNCSNSHYPHTDHEHFARDHWHFSYNYNDLFHENSV